MPRIVWATLLPVCSATSKSRRQAAPEYEMTNCPSGFLRTGDEHRTGTKENAECIQAGHGQHPAFMARPGS